MQKAGALLAISSLPSNFGVGDFGPKAYEFVDILTQMNMQIWQVLPLTPLGFGNSPYQAYSSFAGDDLYISIDKLVSDGLLMPNQAKILNLLVPTVDYETVRAHKRQILAQAFINFANTPKLVQELHEFVKQTPWLTNYAVFLTFKKINDLRPWTLWPQEHKEWIKNKQFDLTPYQSQIEYETFIQFIFFRQWFELKNYANSQGIHIMGDIPIYIGMDSLDVWENQDIFLLDEQQKPTYVAGVPPDFFSETGQLWGNPLYDWQALEANGFKFWIERLRGNSQTFDIIRIDHFRAFDTYWKIPGDSATAINGEWVEAPGYALFDKIYQELPHINIVAEDLGDLRPQVLELRDHYQLKGMKVFQFHFDPQQDNTEFTHTPNVIIYTGTHDNNTLIGWFNDLPHEQQQQFSDYFKANDKTTLKHAIIKFALNCQAEYVIMPIQDILGLDGSGRFNTPGQIGAPNWEWKLSSFNELKSETEWIRQAIIESKRC